MDNIRKPRYPLGITGLTVWASSHPSERQPVLNGRPVAPTNQRGRNRDGDQGRLEQHPPVTQGGVFVVERFPQQVGIHERPKVPLNAEAFELGRHGGDGRMLLSAQFLEPFFVHPTLDVVVVFQLLYAPLCGF